MDCSRCKSRLRRWVELFGFRVPALRWYISTKRLSLWNAVISVTSGDCSRLPEPIVIMMMVVMISAEYGETSSPCLVT